MSHWSENHLARSRRDPLEPQNRILPPRPDRSPYRIRRVRRRPTGWLHLLIAAAFSVGLLVLLPSVVLWLWFSGFSVMHSRNFDAAVLRTSISPASAPKPYVMRPGDRIRVFGDPMAEHPFEGWVTLIARTESRRPSLEQWWVHFENDPSTEEFLRWVDIAHLD